MSPLFSRNQHVTKALFDLNVPIALVCEAPDGQMKLLADKADALSRIPPFPEGLRDSVRFSRFTVFWWPTPTDRYRQGIGS
jgi:hypothetical protein